MARLVTVIVLGSSGGVPTPERMLPSIAVRDWNGFTVLLDAGEGAQLRLVQAGLSVNDIDVVAITHSHGDHINGLPGLLQSMHMHDRRRPLLILADPSAAKFVREALEVEKGRLGFPVNLKVISGSGSTRLWGAGGDTLTLEWFPVCHSIEAYGFKLTWRLRPRIIREALERTGIRPGPMVSRLLEEGEVTVSGRVVKLDDVAVPGGEWTLVYTGDTAPCRTVVDAARGAGLLIHDSSFDGSMREEALERGHSTAVDAASIARHAEVRALILTHISARYRGFEALRLEREARKVFPRSRLAWDLMRATFRV